MAFGDDLYEQENTRGGDAPVPLKGGPDDLTKGSEKERARAALAIWTAKDRWMERRMAQWRANELRRAGVKNVQVRKKENGRWYAWVPPNIETNPDVLQSMNAAASQARKFTSLLLADPPAPQAVPATGEEEDRDAAEFSTRVLLDIQGPRHLNDQKHIRRALDKANTFASGFIWYWVDPTGGGRAPVEVSAGFDPVNRIQARSEDELDLNPVTGLPWTHYREMYVADDGSLTEDPSEARTDWMPALQATVLTGRQVRMIPHTAQDIGEADGVQIADFKPLGQLRRLYPDELGNLSKEEKAALVGFRPDHERWIVPEAYRRSLTTPPNDPDEKLVFVLTTYMKASPDIEEGLCLTTVGKDRVVVDENWVAETDFGTVSLPLPLTQYKQWTEGDDEPYGHSLMEFLGPGNEVRSKIIADWLEHVTRLNNRKMFLPMHSNLRPEDFRLPSKTPLRILPGGEPKYEDVPSFAPDSVSFINFTTNEMQMASGLTQIAQGLESPQVQSGRHAQAIVSQVHAGLSDIRQNIIDGFTRGSRIQLALIRAFFARPRRIGWVGEDGAYKERRWSGADLRQTSDVKLKNGTLTMLTPVAKAQLAEHYATLGVVTPIQLQELVADSMGPLIGLQDDPHRLRIRRQLARFMDGPPDDWQPQFEQVPVPGPDGNPQIDPRTGQPATQPQQIMDPVLMGIWRPYPQDDLPHVALTRLRELAKAMSRTEFAILPPPWQFGLLQEFARAQQAATPTGQQPGQDPQPARSPAQNQDLQGPLAPPATPLPTETPAPAGQVDAF